MGGRKAPVKTKATTEAASKTSKRQKQDAAPPPAQVEEESGDDEDEAAAETNPFQRLFPSAIRLQPDENGKFHYRDGTLMNFQDMNRMNDEFLLKTDLHRSTSAIATFPIAAAELKSKVKLPLKYVGTAASFEETDPANRKYEHVPMVRNNVATLQFRAKFTANKFNMQRYLLLVPAMSTKDEAEYKSDRIAFLTKMMLPANLKSRKWWICDGANRWQICKDLLYDANYAILDPSIPEQGCMRYATFQNEDVDAKNETSYMVCKSGIVQHLHMFCLHVGQDSNCWSNGGRWVRIQCSVCRHASLDEDTECGPKIRAGTAHCIDYVYNYFFIGGEQAEGGGGCMGTLHGRCCTGQGGRR
jgi:hypothetical protein